MFNECFLNQCKSVGVESICELPNNSEEGVRVNMKDGSYWCIIFHQQYGEAWIDYEEGSHYEERWKNIKILTPEESAEYNKRVLQTMIDKYSEPNFSIFLSQMFPEIKNTNQ